MNVKIIAKFFVITCLVSCHSLAMSVPPGGCYECEEEVWEEIPCEDIPKNCTTTTTTTTTTTSTTTTSTTTTTTPRPTPPTTEDPYKRCYCECKVGCKEFCRKVITNPEPKKQILQVSKITEPIPQGRLESTHYHQRELIPKKGYNSRYNSIYPGSYAAKSKSYNDLPSDSDKYSQSNEVPPPRPYNSLPTNSYYENPHGSRAYVKAHATPINVGHDQSHGAYDYSIPIANAYSKYTKTVQDPLGNNLQVSVATSNTIPRQFSRQYSSPTPVKSPVLSTPITLGSSGGYDSLESYIKDIMQGSPSTNYQTYNRYGGHQYSMSFR